MSFAACETSSISRLANLFEAGTTVTSAKVLFEDMDIDEGQKHSICESLKARGVIKPTYQLGQRLPYIIEILPAAVRERDSVAQVNQAENRAQRSRGVLDTVYRIALLWFGDPNARFAKFFAIAGVALIAAPWWQPILQQLAVKHLGIEGGFLANSDRTMFWSGWVFVAIALVLYVWVKRLPAREKQQSKTKLSDPIEIAMEYYFNGSDSILTLNTPTNPLLAEGVVAVYPTAPKIVSFNGHYDGLIGESAVRNSYAGNPSSLLRYVVEVTKFEPILSFNQIGAGRGAADAIEAAFLLSDRSGYPFPWCFDAEEVLLKTFDQTKKLETPYNLTANDLVALRYFINAKDAGIYFVHCVVYVLAKGSASPIRIPLHEEPIPIAFYEIDETEPDETDDLIEFPLRSFA